MEKSITDADIQSATWIVGQPGDKHGVYVTTWNILVKFGRHVRARREELTINFIRDACPQIPVPKVYGSWETTEGDGVTRGYIAMSTMPGTMLRDAWPAMSVEEKESVLADLDAILKQLRQIPVPNGALVGAVDGVAPAADSRGRHTEFGGPFRTESEFNEWLISLIHPDSMQYFSSFYIETIRNSLNAKCGHQLRFTHADLGMHNILVEGKRITAIIDWEYAGWYPEYWEYVKMIQFSRDKMFRCWARECWQDEEGNGVFYDQEFVVDQMLDSQVRHGERVIKRPR